MSKIHAKIVNLSQIISQCHKIYDDKYSQIHYKIVWECMQELIKQNLNMEKIILIQNYFYLTMYNVKNLLSIQMIPTSSLINQIGLNYHFKNNQIDALSITFINTNYIYKHVNTKFKRQKFIDQEQINKIYHNFWKYIKINLQNQKNIQLELNSLGTIRMHEKTYTHSPNFKVTSPKQSNISRQKNRNRQKGSKLNSSKIISLKSEKYNHIKENMNSQRKSKFLLSCEQIKSKQIHICSDLLGAGLDPLTYEYNLSNLLYNTQQLLQKKFTSLPPVKVRYPCIVDKFSRNMGVQSSGVKISMSSVVRIASNFSPLVRNLYIDLQKKCIAYVPSEIQVKLNSKGNQTIPIATQLQQYLFVSGKKNDNNLKILVQARRNNYFRYHEYIRKLIPNSSVPALHQSTLKNIIKKINFTKKSILKKVYQTLLTKLINEVNKYYYISYKKSVLDYILKDKNQMSRLGINQIFNSLLVWNNKYIKRNNSNRNTNFIFTHQSSKKHPLRDKIQQFSNCNYLLYPECLLEIVKYNEIIQKMQLFLIKKDIDIKPINVLYYLKKSTQHLNEKLDFLMNKWVQDITNIVLKFTNNIAYSTLLPFLSSVNVILSNDLKNLIYNSLVKISSFFKKYITGKKQKPSILLLISLAEQNGKIIFIDDCDKVFRNEINNILNSMIERTKKIPKINKYFQNNNNEYLWSVEMDDEIYQHHKKLINMIIDDNFQQINVIRNKIAKVQNLFELKSQITNWCVNSPNVFEAVSLVQKILILEEQIRNIQAYYVYQIACIDCHQLKKKLLIYCKKMKRMVSQSIEEMIKNNNEKIIKLIQQQTQLIQKPISSTKDYVIVNNSIEDLTIYNLKTIIQQINNNRTILLKLYQLHNSLVLIPYQMLYNIYQSHVAYEILQKKIIENKERVNIERYQLQKNLKEKIELFSKQIAVFSKDIDVKIDSFQIRKMYTEYLGKLISYKKRVQESKLMIAKLNKQEQDLEWTLTVFSDFKEIEDMVIPNTQLWSIVSEYQICMKEWRPIQLRNMNIEDNLSIMNILNQRLSKIIPKLINYYSIKIYQQLQNDIRQFLMHHADIIKIFCHPGLKQKHWHLFSKKLVIPGYDLKQLCFGKIKILYQYEKNLKWLSVISHQAIKQYDIEIQKCYMLEYWNKAILQTIIYEEKIIIVPDRDLKQQLTIIEDHIVKTSIAKNSPYAKNLMQMLLDWQNWLLEGRSILTIFSQAQEKFLQFKNLFKIESICKFLPIENTEYQAIENIWKSVVWKILEQPKIITLFRSHKIKQIFEQIKKKNQFILNGINTFICNLRLDFTRLYLISNQTMLQFLNFIGKNQEYDAFMMIIKFCFEGVKQLQFGQQNFKRMTSMMDYIDLSELKRSDSCKGKKIQVIVEFKNIEKILQNNVYEQIILIEQKNHQNKEYCLTSILCAQILIYSNQLTKATVNNKLKNLIQNKQKQIKNLISNYQAYKVCLQDILISRKIFQLEQCRDLNFKGIVSIDDFDFTSLIKFSKDEKNIKISVCQHSILFGNQYLGTHVVPLIPLNSQKFIWQLIFSLSHSTSCVISGSKQNNLVRQMASVTGHVYKELNTQKQVNLNNIDTLVGAIIGSGVWINLHDDYFQFNFYALNLISKTLKQKRQRISNGMNVQLQNSNQMIINPHTSCFLNFNHRSFNTVPQKFKIAMRVISANPSTITDMIYKLGMRNWSKFAKIKMFLQIFECFSEQFNTFEFLSNLFSSINNNTTDKQIELYCRKQIKSYLNEEDLLIYDESVLYYKSKYENIKINSQNHIRQLQQQKNQFILNFNLYKQLIEEQIKFYDIILIYGQYSFKSSLIQTIIRNEGSHQSTISDKRINLAIIQNTQFDSKILINKIRKCARNKNQNYEFIVIDSELNSNQFKLLTQYMKNQQSNSICNQESKRNQELKFIIESRCIKNIDPTEVTKSGKIHINIDHISYKSIFQSWLNKLSIEKIYKSIIRTFIDEFSKMMDFVSKLAKIIPVKENKLTISQRFMKLFQMYLQNFNIMDIEYLTENEIKNYIKNSIVFTSYWSLSFGLTYPTQHYKLQKFLKDTFSCSLSESENIFDYYYNESNQWIEWSRLKQQFTVSQKNNKAIYKLWVPTLENTKLYTISIKLIQNSIPLLIYGQQNGKTTLLKQISNFEISSSTLFIDCYKCNSSQNIIKTIKHKVIYGKEKKVLIMVDDIHLPIKSSICEIFRSIIENQEIVNLSSLGKINQALLNTSLLLTTNQIKKSCPSFQRMLSKTVPLHFESISESQLNCIFHQYLYNQFQRSQFDTQIIKCSQSTTNFIIKSIKLFGKYLHIQDIRKIIENLCELNNKQIKEKKQLITYTFTQVYNYCKPRILHSPLYNNFIKYFQTEHSKFLPYCSNFIAQLQQYTISIQINHSYCSSIQQTQSKIIAILEQKNHKFIACPFFLIRILYRLISVIKHESHFILIGHRVQGAKNIAKITALVNELLFIQLGKNTTAKIFIQQVIKILKTGGKIDQCICVLPNQSNKQKQFLSLINNLVCSPEFYSCFSQFQIQLICKSFNSEKKNIKNVELIKRMRQKFDKIFHIILCMDDLKVQQSRREYPNLINKCHAIGVWQWPEYALNEVVNKTLIQTNPKVIAVIKQIYKQSNKLYKEHNCSQKLGVKTMSDFMRIYLRLIQYYFKKSSKSQEDTFLWENKIKLNHEKLQSLKEEKKKFQKANQNHFQVINQMQELIKQKLIELEYKNKQYEIISEEKIKHERQLQKLKQQFFQLKLISHLEQFMENIGEIQQEEYFELSSAKNELMWKIRSIYDPNVESGQSLSKKQYMQLLNKCRHDYMLMIIDEEEELEQFKNKRKDKSTNNKIEKLLQNLLLSHWQSFKLINKLAIKIDQQNIKYQSIKQKYWLKLSSFRDLEDQIENIKQIITEKYNSNNQLKQSYEEITNKIIEAQKIESLMNKFKKILKTKQYMSGQNRTQLTGVIIMASFRLIFNSQCKKIKTELDNLIQKILSQNNIDFDQKNIIQMLSYNDQVKFKYLYEENSFNCILTYIIIDISDYYTIAIDKEQLLYKFFKKVKKNIEVAIIDGRKIEEFRQVLSLGKIILIKRPTSKFMEEITNFLHKRIQNKNGCKVVNINEDCVIHKNTRVVFIYENEGQIPYCIRNKLIIKFNYNTEILQNKVKNICYKYLNQSTSINYNLDEQIQSYLKSIEELTFIDEKLYKVIKMMRKQKHISDQTILNKIEAIAQEKKQMENRIDSNLMVMQESLSIKNKYCSYAQQIVSIYSYLSIGPLQYILIVRSVTKKYFDEQLSFQQVINKINQICEIFNQKSSKIPEKINNKKIMKMPNLKKMKQYLKQKILKTQVKNIFDLFFILSHQNIILKSNDANFQQITELLLKCMHKYQIVVYCKRLQELISFSSSPIKKSIFVILEVKIQQDWFIIQNWLKLVSAKKSPKYHIIIITCSSLLLPYYLSQNFYQIELHKANKYLINIKYSEIDQSNKNQYQFVVPYYLNQYLGQQNCHSTFENFQNILYCHQILNSKQKVEDSQQQHIRISINKVARLTYGQSNPIFD